MPKYKMSLGTVSMCIYKAFADEPGPIWTTTLEFLFSIIGTDKSWNIFNIFNHGVFKGKLKVSSKSIQRVKF